jgi:predicted peptidase
MRINFTFIIIILLLLTGLAEAQDLSVFEKQLFIRGEDTLNCRILSPLNYSPSKKYPLLVFLHGSGERGNDNEAQLKWGGTLFADSANRAKYPAIVVFPQCPVTSSWAVIKRGASADSLGGFSFPIDQPATKPLQLVMDFIDTLVKHGQVDTKRIYIGGLSMGGFGTFEILWRKPNMFAAAIPVCGGGNPEAVKSYAKKFPVWIFHGAKDLIVPVGNSRLMVNTLKAAGADVKYSEYPEVNHDSWNNAFAEPDLLNWLFAQKKK